MRILPLVPVLALICAKPNLAFAANCDDNYEPLAGVAYDATSVYVSACLSQGLALRPSTICAGHRVSFRIGACSSEHGLKINFGDGAGFRSVSNGDVVEVSYGSVGRYEVSATAEKITDPPHVYRQSKSLEVTGLTYRAPDQTSTIDATVNGTSYSGDVFIYRSDPDGEIRSPVIVTDGFDPGNARDGRCLYSLFNRHNLLEEGLRKGWDFFVLNFSAGAGAIQGNAAVLEQLIQMVNEMKSGIAPVAVVGPSMGGLVSRYALLDMEARGIDHEVAVFISFDSPHKGANIPYGDQLWVHYFSNNSPGASDGVTALNSTAARQMLLYHAARFAHVAPVYDTFS